MPRGRPRRDYEPVIVQVGDFILHPEYDADLIAFFQAVPRRKRIATLKTALRSGGLTTVREAVQVELEELQEAVKGFF